MTFKIKAYYRTGDSFVSHDEETELEMSWEKEENAKAALQRMKEHYNWYEIQHNRGSYRWDKRRKDLPQEPEWHKGKYETTVIVLLDNGNPVEFGAPWCGYFESLQSLEIFVDHGDWKVEF